MWLNVRWYDDVGGLVAEDGAYGDLEVELDGIPTTVRTLLNPDSTRVYEAHGAISQQWASQLLGLGYSPSMPVVFDPITGTVTTDLGDVAAQAPGTSQESLHFVLNNVVKLDNRIPPYGMRFDTAQERNALPVPANQYGDPGPGGTYDYFDVVALNPPLGATYAEIDLLYQPTSWEYIQFLYLANNGSVSFLASTGADLLEAWQATGMAAPEVVASATWVGAATPVDCNDGLDNDGDGAVDADDPGCSSTDDPTEKNPAEPCDDGIDNDGDGRIDFDVITYNDPAFQAGFGDPGCGSPNWGTESPQCQDGLDNDSDSSIDFDRGASATGQAISAEPDQVCVGQPWRDTERPPSDCNVKGGGGGGAAPFIILAMLLLPLVTTVRRRRG